MKTPHVSKHFLRALLGAILLGLGIDLHGLAVLVVTGIVLIITGAAGAIDDADRE
jgi:hypothetical protein